MHLARTICAHQRSWTSSLRLARSAHSSSSGSGSGQYSHTLQLPKTDFAIRPKVAEQDKKYVDRTSTALYKWQRTRTNATGDFVFHDGPPYANGSLHCGHALNKILKDIANRYQVLRGKRVHYMPGWDCHGLPIELKALAKLKGEKLSAIDLRKRARSEALEAIETQKAEFTNFGIMADWSHTYRTLDPKYEARQLRVFGEMVRKGLIYRQFKPVYWSPSNKTALAESELEYREDHESKAVYVSFVLLPTAKLAFNMPLKAVIWTTTPWSLPSNMAVCIHPELEYSIVQRGDHALIIASERVAALSGIIGQLEELGRVKGADLVGCQYRTPLGGTGSILQADYVTATSGTGLVHSAPAHGAEDYEVWRQQRATGETEATDLISPIDDLGRFDETVGEGEVRDRLVGKPVLTTGASEVISILRERGALVHAHTLRHKYPYDWRSKKPVIVRATAQWFANLDKVKGDALEALEAVEFVPASSRARLEAFVRGRSEWCISRQRAWGVPIPVLYAGDEALMTVENVEHIAAILETKGTDYWWQGAAEEFVAPQYRTDKRWAGLLRKGEDTIDVWFDSGTSWATLQEDVGSSAPADVYLEGSDQHRGWFQSSLITAVACRAEGSKPIAPYRTLVTHGYVLDKEKRKMSKSIGNVVSPLTIVAAQGIDVLRLWVARSDYTSDVAIGQEIVGKTAEALRKLRNTARFMLANLGRSEVPSLQDAQLTLVDRYVMHELHSLETACRASYDRYDYAQVVRRVTEFAGATLSNFYLDIGKDSLYCDAVDSERRQSMVAVLDTVLRTFTGLLAPIVPLLAEEIWEHRGAGGFAHGWPAVDPKWKDEGAATKMQKVLTLRGEVLGLTEDARRAGTVKTSLDAHVTIADTHDVSLAELTEILNVASVELGTDVTVKASEAGRCVRCRCARGEPLCERCMQVVAAMPV